MAAFDNTPQYQEAPNFTGRSQGIQSSPNTGLGMLFESIAGALDAGIKVADQANKDAIEHDIFTEVDAIQAEFGVDDATIMEADAESSRPLPAGIQAAGENLARLENAYRKGPTSGVSESHYWARMNNMVRQLRAKYPGYRAEIDEMVASVTGARPANALRSALFNEWNASAEADPYQKLVDKAIWEGRLPADFFQRQEAGNAYSLTELQSYIATRERQAADIADQKAQLEFANSQGTLNEKEALRTFQAEAAQMVTTLLSDSSTQIGSTYTALSERILDAQRSAARSEPIDTVSLNTAFAELKGLVHTQLRQMSLQQFGHTASDTYIAMISDPKEIDAAIAQAMWPINLMEDAIINENYGIAQSMAAWLESTKNMNSRELLTTFPEIGRLQALKDIAGPTVTDLLLAASPSTVHALTKRLLDTVTVAASTGQGDITQAFALGEQNDQGEDYYNGLIKRWQNTIQEAATGSLPLEVVQNNVQYMFGVDSQSIFAQMNDADKYEYYRQVVSPIVTNQMLQLKANGDEQSWNTYQTWAINAFVGLFRESVQDLQRINTSSRFNGVSVRWDRNINGFIIQTEGLFGIGGFEGPVRNLNTSIQTIAPIIQANGEDVSENLLELINGMGWDPSIAREEGFNLIEALGKALAGGMIRPGDPNYPGLPPGMEDAE